MPILTLDDMLKQVADTNLAVDRSQELPKEQPKHYSLDNMLSEIRPENDPATAISPDETAPVSGDIGINPLEMANYAGGVGSGMLIGSAGGPVGTFAGGVVGGGLAAMSNKGYRQGTQIKDNTKNGKSNISGQYIEQLKEALGGMAIGASIAAPEAVAPVRGAIGALEQTAKFGMKAGAKEAGKYALERGITSGAASYPFNILQEKINNPNASALDVAGKAGEQSLIYGGTELATAGFGSAGKIYKGSKIASKVTKYVAGADDLAKTIQDAGGPALTTAQAMKDTTVSNKAFNFVKNLWGGGELKNLEESQIQKLSDYSYKLVDNLKNGMPADKAVRELSLKLSVDSVNAAMTKAGKSINIKDIKELANVPSIKRMEDLTSKTAKIIDSIIVDAGNVLGEKIPSGSTATDVAQRAQLFKDKYNKVFKYVDETGQRVDIGPVKKAIGVVPSDKQFEYIQKDLVTGQLKKGVQYQEGFEDAVRRGIINDFTTKDAKRIVAMLPEGADFGIVHANRSALGRAEQRATDPVVKRIFAEARLAMTKAMDETALRAGPEQYKMFKAVDSAYGQTQLYEDLTGKMGKTPFTELQPVINKPVLQGKALAEYLRANKNELLGTNKLSPDKFNELYQTSLEQMNIQDKSSALRNAPGHTKQLYDLYDNITGNQAFELKAKLKDSLKDLDGVEAANVRTTIKKLDVKTATAAKSAGVYDQWKTVNEQIDKDSLNNRLSDMLQSNSVLDKNNVNTVRGGLLSKSLDKNEKNLIDAYGMKPDHFAALKSVALSLNKIENATPSGTAVLIGGQVSAAARSPQIVVKSLLGETAAAVGQTANVATVGVAPWLVSKILDNPYVLGSSDATKVLARELEKITTGRNIKIPFTGNTALLRGVVGKAAQGISYEEQASIMSKVYATYLKDNQRNEKLNNIGD